MKFAKELERELVPEWRVKYLNYKAGKKHVKAVTKAIQRANTPLALPSRAHQTLTPYSTYESTPRRAQSLNTPSPNLSTYDKEIEAPSRPVSRPIPTRKPTESDRLTDSPGNGVQYGSFVPTPGYLSPTILEEDDNPFELPAPALKDNNALSRANTVTEGVRAWAKNAAGSRPTTHGSWSSRKNPPPTSAGASDMSNTTIEAATCIGNASPHPLQRLFSNASVRHSNRDRGGSTPAEISLQNLDLVRERQRDFFSFLDAELEKVEKFYRSKEDQAGKRLTLLREQLHEMRNRRINEIAWHKSKPKTRSSSPNSMFNRRTEGDEEDGTRSKRASVRDSILSNIDSARALMPPLTTKFINPGPNSKALQKMAQTPVFSPIESNLTGVTSTTETRKDFIRRPDRDAVPYRTAKRKLKLALQEFYRSLELLKAYALLNRTAFRKLNKKYDKAVRARPPYRYMNEKVNSSYFVTSDVLETYIQTVEDLYARYFEKGNRKVAAGKLRSFSHRDSDRSSSAFRNGVLIGTGVVFAIQGLSFAVKLLSDDDATVRQRTSYLLQIYGGYFLMLYLFIMFCIDCRFWNKYKINYPFIFELDARHHLDWRQLAEFPSFFTFVFGVIMWLNFSRYDRSPEMYLFYPIILIAFTGIIIFLPAPVFRARSRSWFVYSHWRLLLAGFYPVEFRDFFLGDIYCSLTYATCNIELFFCLYANRWDNPVQCNSNHSRLLGFFSALPPIWRFLQCLRRYRDTRNVFPHLVNAGKYTMSIVAAMTLSFYRINPTAHTLGAFIAFSTFNAVYCSIWDLFMDFSLLQPHSTHPLLRDITALKYLPTYYIIMTLDPILRFSWIALAIFTHESQHSNIVSFTVALLEVTRRAMWALIRVENEHCANVAVYKASRDVPLPYTLGKGVEDVEAGIGVHDPLVCGAEGVEESVGVATGAAVNGGVGGAGMGLGGVGMGGGSGPRRRVVGRTDTTRSISQMLAAAHTQDFEKRRPRAEEVVAVEEDEDGSDVEDGMGSSSRGSGSS